MVLLNPPKCTLTSTSADTKSVLVSVCADTRWVQCLLLRGHWDFLLSAATSCELTETEETPPPWTIVPGMLPFGNLLTSLILLPLSLTLRYKVWVFFNIQFPLTHGQSLYLWGPASIFCSLISCFYILVCKLWCIHIPSQLNFLLDFRSLSMFPGSGTL